MALQDLLAKLKHTSNQARAVQKPGGGLLFAGTVEDREYLQSIEAPVNWARLSPFKSLPEFVDYCKAKNSTQVLATQTELLILLLAQLGNHKTSVSLDPYTGSFFSHEGIDIVFINPLKQLFTVPYGKFLARRYISKLLAPQNWYSPSEFRFAIATEESAERIYSRLAQSFAMAVDIETVREGLRIRCISFCGIFPDGTTEAFVFPCTSEFFLAYIRKICALPAAKIFQNGKYDNLYLLRYGIPVYNWLWDTANLAHCYYCELPKDLAFQNAFYMREVIYWKDLAETSDIKEYYKYNAKDTWATANVWMAQMMEMPAWALRNYELEFRLNFPCLLSELTGIPRDMERLQKARAEVVSKEESILATLRTITGCPYFNPSSPPQVLQLLRILGVKDPEGTGEDLLATYSFAHPFNARILGLILEYRGLKKERTTYLRTDDDITKTSKRGGKEYRETIFYSLKPDGTDTARLASRESGFWCGLQIQNIPAGGPTKTTLRVPEGFTISEADLEQAESRDTGYISGDSTLITAVSSGKDFHSFNASAFFGMPYEEIYDDERKEPKRKDLRTLAKPINHGANYNMGDAVLVSSMGLEMIYKVKAALNLPFYDPKDIAACCLTTFHLTYKTLRGIIKFRNPAVAQHFGLENPPYKLFAPGTYYAKIAEEIKTTNRITSRAYHHTKYNLSKYPDAESYIVEGDWTRWCFGNPSENKMHLNAYVAHPSQSLNARTLNEAYMEVFYQLALKYPKDFRLYAQIHDSILFGYRLGMDWMQEQVKALMEIPVTVRDVHGIVRTFTVPAATKGGKGAVYWSECE